MAMVLSVKDWLKTSYNINVNGEWLSTCIEFIQQETQNSAPSLDHLNRLVLEQWLVSDLSEVALPLIPDEVYTSHKCHLHQLYPLQMISVLDVAMPLYSQIQKLEGDGKESGVDMISFSDDPFEFANTQNGHNNNNSHKPKPSRMLKLELTDGHRHIHAIEYKPIRVLNTNLLPGTKILIKGSVLCRRQVLLLEEDNVCVMGGEVDDLVVVNNPLTNLQAEMEKNRQELTGNTDL